MMSNGQNPRYAIYFAGASQGDFWNLGSQWLSRCAAGRFMETLPKSLGVDPLVLEKMTSQPRRYGWHATLKAPFSLKEGFLFEDLHQRLNLLVHELHAFELPTLELRVMKDFLALTPVKSTQLYPQLVDVGNQCVQRLHPLARPLNENEIAYRKRVDLNPREEALMLQWGYPFVQELFEFHFTLSNNLSLYDASEVSSLIKAAKIWFKLTQPISFDRISLFVEEKRGENFMFLRDYSFTS